MEVSSFRRHDREALALVPIFCQLKKMFFGYRNASKFTIKAMPPKNEGFQIIASDASYLPPLFVIYENDS